MVRKSDLISRKAVCNWLNNMEKYGRKEDAHGYHNTCAYVSQMPSAEPERKNGKWIPVDAYSAFGGDEATWMAHGNPVAFYYCSECKEQAYAGEDGESLLTKFCPNCGADMRGEEDE